MKKFGKRTWIALVAALAVAVAAVGGYAYWTTAGDGSGTAATGTTADLVVTQLAPAPVDLVPGGPARDVKVDVENTRSFNQYLTSLTFEVDPAWSEQADTTKPACTGGDFQLVQPTVANVDLTPGDHSGAAYTGTIALKNLGTNQDNCKNVSVPLLLHAN